jgi:RNA polymerase sigma-70 factor, ECF subfamily
MKRLAATFSDADILGGLQSGEQRAVGLLFERYARLAFSTALRMLNSHADAEDVTQEVFLSLLRRGSTFDPAKGTAAAWIFQVTRSRSLTHLERRSRPIVECGDLSEAEHELADPGGQPERMADWFLLAEVFSRAQGRLSEAQRETLELCLVEGYSLVEVSEKRREQLGNTRHHYYRGIAVLRALFDRAGNRSAQM